MTDLARSFAEQLRARLGSFSPRAAIILGSGLGALGEMLENPVTIPYSELKDFPQSTIAGHRGCFLAGNLQSCPVLCMQGRIHLYEGYPPQLIAAVIKSFKLLGITSLIVTNAAGSLHRDMPPGSLMMITDHINFSGTNPLIGRNDETCGPRFPAMNYVYTAEYREQLCRIAAKHGITLHEGVYFWVSGPSFETPAEIRAYRILGADAVGMSTVPETITAAYCGLKVLGISVITNFGSGMENTSLSHEETLAQTAAATEKLTLLVRDFIKEL